MAQHVLIVEDSPDQAMLIAGLLQAGGYSSETVSNGRLALAAIERRVPDLVATDLVMPAMDGLQLVEEVCDRWPTLPVILMTAYGTASIAVEALRKGAASFVPKRRLVEEFLDTVRSTLILTEERRQRTRILAHLTESRHHFLLGNDQSLVPPLVGFIQETIANRFPTFGENDLMQLGIALQEALFNAIQHGNLEVSSDLRNEGSERFHQEIERRRKDPRYCSRQVTVRATVSSRELVCEIEDEGPGFDPAVVPDPTDPENLLKVSGRGLYLIGTFMDEVRFNAAGNRLTMVRRLIGGPADGSE